MSTLPFKDKRNIELPSVAPAVLANLRQDLAQRVGVMPLQSVESASFSLAMVSRFALGLSASGGAVGAIVRDNLSGWIALATLRHLLNSGSAAHVVLLDQNPEQSKSLPLFLTPLSKNGASIITLSELAQSGQIPAMLGACHNILYGVVEAGGPADQGLNKLHEILNEHPTPVHAIEAPGGLDLEQGQQSGTALYASSTLSLGLPLNGLIAGNEFVGRHYLCDIGLPLAAYRNLGLSGDPLFSEQPVIQIFPNQPAEA